MAGLSAASAATVSLEVADSLTGFGVPAEVTMTAGDGSTQVQTLPPSGLGNLTVPDEGITVTLAAPGYEAMSAALGAGSAGMVHRFSLDRLPAPVEDSLAPASAPPPAHATVFHGYVSGSDTRQPLAGVRVVADPSGAEALSDDQGRFAITVPVQRHEEWQAAPARIAFHQPGYQSEERVGLEIWPGGAWHWAVVLRPGTGTNTVDEGKQHMDYGAEPASFSALAPASPAGGHDTPSQATSLTNATVRVPRNIRVQLTNGTIEYVSMDTYTMRSLSGEWISGWGNYTGGMNSMRSGAVAVRSYAAAYIRNPRGSTYDICASTSCQVFSSSFTVNASNAAVQTSGYVAVNPANNTIASTEYSSENNSLGFSCGDGYVQPTGGCIYDPVCTGETRYGHGRNMCQWGTAKWATGRKFPGNSTSDATTLNGQPVQDWTWIVTHYYPNLKLAKGTPLMEGDDVKVAGSSVSVRMCADGGIASGTGCPLIATKAVGATGVIVTNSPNPLRVTTDGMGYTWYKIRWSDGTVGWAPENWLDRVIPAPAAPSNLAATALSATQVRLNWTESGSWITGYSLERAATSSGPWSVAADLATNSLSQYTDTSASPSTTNYYRLRAYNLGGNSPYSNLTNAVTPGIPPLLPPIANKTITEGALLTFTNTATTTNPATTLADFEGKPQGSQMLFRTPLTSGTTTNFLNATPNIAGITNSFPAFARSGASVLHVAWSFNSVTNPWMRLTTWNATNVPNPVINLSQQVRFDFYCDRPVKVCLGCRETTNAPGTALGSDGGAAGAIEWIGATGKNGSQPLATRTIPAGVWTNLVFDLTNEPVAAFTGNGVLGTASGLGVFEEIPLVPNAGTGTYNVYLDNVVVGRPKRLTYSLEPGAPAGAGIQSDTGVFTWTPTEAQGPGSYPVTVRVTDDSPVPQTATQTFSVTVLETNAVPTLTAVSNRFTYPGLALVVTNLATDPDLPTNTLTFSLEAGAPAGVQLDASTGVLTWTPANAWAGTSQTIGIRATDNGTPPLSRTNSFQITVQPLPALAPSSWNGHSLAVQCPALPGKTYRWQYKNSLSDPAWTTQQTVTATGAQVTFTNTPSGPRRFYRLAVSD